MKEVKLLAEFLGYVHDTESGDYYIKGQNYQLHKVNTAFDKDWNALMRVVTKIEDTEHSEDNAYCVQIGSSQYASIIDAEGKMGEAIFSEGLPKIECVFNVCVEFVKMYNSKDILQRVVDRIKSEDEVDVYQREGKIYIELPSGRNLQISEEEVEHHIRCLKEEKL